MSRFLLILSAIALVGCANPAQESSIASLEGRFKAVENDGFEISGTEYVQYNNADLEVSYKGTIANSPDLTAESGTLIVKITDAGTWGMTVDTYHGVRWKGLKAAGVQHSSAATTTEPYKAPAPTTLEDAITTFVGTSGDQYFTYYGEYARQ